MAHIAGQTPSLLECCENQISSHAQNAAKRQTNWVKHITHFADFIAGILQRRAQRRALMRLSDSALSDIGLSRADAYDEYQKPFWRP